MGWFGSRVDGEVPPEQKWDYISLKDFKSTSCFTPFAYAYLWFSLMLSTAVYVVDGFTAYNLLRFSKWSSEIQLTQLVPFDVSKWIFSICIILSVLNLAYEHIRAQLIMKRGSVAECYLDNLVVRLESTRLGKRSGWKRFLVFAELTKSKKGAEYVALFTYFSFQSWIRVLLCSGPRQAINALTLWSVYKAKLTLSGDNFGDTFSNFFAKIKALGAQQTLILSGMLFTLIIWVFSILSLLLAANFFVFFLWHYIPREDGGLSAYCARRANKRLMKIVSIKINKAMAEDERRRKKAELKAAKKNGAERPVSMQATLPNVSGHDKPIKMPSITRTETMTTLPAYSSRPGTPGSYELRAFEQTRPSLFRTTTASSKETNHYSSGASLLGGAADMGYTRSASPALSLPPLDTMFGAQHGTRNSNHNFGPNGRTPLRRMPASDSSIGGTPYPSSDAMSFSSAPVNSPTVPQTGYRGTGPQPRLGMPSLDQYSNGLASPALSMTSYHGGPPSPHFMGLGPEPNRYPSRSATGPMPPRGPPHGFAPQRNMTNPTPIQMGRPQTSSNSSLRNMTPGSRPVQTPTQSSPDYFNRSRPAPRGEYDKGRPGASDTAPGPKK